MKLKLTSSVLCAVVLAMAGCAVGPDYKPPPVEAPVAFKENPKEWQVAKPNDAIDRGAWWSVFKDPVLDKLEHEVEVSNQNLKAAEASWRQARALVDESRSALFPTATLNSSGIRSGGGNKTANQGKSVTTYDLTAGASWEVDIWGRIRRTIESDIASAQASAADLALARLSAQGDLATAYFSLRSQDELKRILNETVTADKRALTIVQNQYNEGIAAKADVLTAQTQLESVKAQAINVNVQRAQLEHAIAVLIGKPPAALTIKPVALTKNVPRIPTGVPSALLERRPDVASAERLMAAANADIGVQEAAWFPDLNLSGSFGYTAMKLANILAAPYSLWSFGPQIAETVFDAGAREARIEQAEASYQQTVANYRQTVLVAFQQVEDQLSALHWLGEQAKVEKQVVADARKAEELVLNQYKAGTVPYSSVITAQTTRLSNEQTALTVQQNRLVAAVALIQALGGGWDVSQLAKDKQPGDVPPKPAPVEPKPLMTEAAPPTSAPVADKTPIIGNVGLYTDPPPTASASNKTSNFNRGG